MCRSKLQFKTLRRTFIDDKRVDLPRATTDGLGDTLAGPLIVFTPASDEVTVKVHLVVAMMAAHNTHLVVTARGGSQGLLAASHDGSDAVASLSKLELSVVLSTKGETTASTFEDPLTMAIARELGRGHNIGDQDPVTVVELVTELVPILTRDGGLGVTLVVNCGDVGGEGETEGREYG
eukprot:TRINITY_DN1121_c0_g1_i4.p1 TRINITY_DN1121_c0_g1~~TRINITY_DN1121_c0_g1_i4.p1  ORF type:complete len:179 (+),score=17.74 TRINITY_DN1121_c0_g1_i4:107-643(+)